MSIRQDRYTLAEEFVRAFCKGNLERIERLLTEDFRFRGPLLAADSRAEYLEALAAEPPSAEGRYDLLGRSADGEGVRLVYRYHKPGASFRIEQSCEFRGSRIRAMELDFDPLERS